MIDPNRRRGIKLAGAGKGSSAKKQRRSRNAVRSLGGRVMEHLEARALMAGDLVAAITATESDAYEPNNTLVTARPLGTDTRVIIQDLTIDNVEDDDFFRIVPAQSGAMSVGALFENDNGNLDLRVLDVRGNVLATSATNGDEERVIIPVVAGAPYVIQVFSATEEINVYTLDLNINAAPVPFYVGLEASTSSDTGRSDTDGVTLNSTPRILVQTDLEPLSGIPILTAAQAAAGVSPGAAVQIILTRVVDGTQTVGFADRVGTGELFSFRPAASLAEGRYLLWARWQIRDGQRNGDLASPAIGPGSASASSRIVIDLTNPTGSEPSLGSASDTGMSSTDGVTNMKKPFFVGIGEPGAIVRLFANGTLVGETVAQSDGRWEITSEPLRDNIYDMTVQYEDLAGRVTEEGSTRIEVDTLTPNTPYLDLVPASDTGHSNFDNITGDTTPTFTLTTTDPNNADHLSPFNFKFRIFLRPQAGSAAGNGAETLIYESATDPNITAADRDADGFTRLNFITTTLANALPNGVRNLKLEVEDRAGNISPDYLLTIEIDATPIPDVDLRMLNVSDSGMVNDDLVTNIAQPAFTGRSKPGSMVMLFANGELVGEATVGSDASDVGRVAGATATDGLGLWEITSEPLRDGVHSMVARVEDWTNNIAESDPLVIEVDTLVPNTPYLDLTTASDTGRHNEDNITSAATLNFTLTTTDPLAANHLTLFPDGQNFKYRLFARPQEGAEILIYSSETDATLPNKLNGFTSATLVSAANIVLPEGAHNLKLEVEDRAGNISYDYLLDLVVDRSTPPGTGRLHPDSDTGIWGVAGTLVDRITEDSTPRFTGTAEANAIVSATVNGQPIGVAVAVPLSGNDAFQPPTAPNNVTGNWVLESSVAFAEGENTVVFTFEDPAGNRSTSELDIFVDTTGPRIRNITRNDAPFTSLFQPKPTGGPDPLIPSIVIHFEDTPGRTDTFDYAAIVSQLALEEGNYRLVGDANGNIPIVDVNILASTTTATGATMQVELVFAEPLPDDRFTLTVSDTLADAAGNKLDGESGAAAPFIGNNGTANTLPTFPTGDGQHGGSFVARFTVDSRPEIGVWAAGSIWVDTNGNKIFDPENLDYVNRDIIYKLEFTSDDIFAGNFAAANGTTDGFDKLAAYGKFNGGWRFLVDLDNDGVPNINIADPANVNGLPFAGRFDASATNGDEVGVFDGSTWFFDTDHNWQVDQSLATNMRGYPVVGDFDGDGFDDLATWADDRFQIDLANGALRGWDGAADVTFRFGFIGVRERPVAADMDQDGFEDLGLWAPDRQGVVPVEHSEWYFLVSGGESLLARVAAAENPIHGLPEVDFTPTPFGNDFYAKFGDGFALPVVGNFDPPVLPASSTGGSTGGSGGNSNGSSGNNSGGNSTTANPLDVNRDGLVSPVDALLVINELNRINGQATASAATAGNLDTNGDGAVSPLDALLIINELNKLNASSAAVSAAPPVAAAATSATASVEAASVDAVFSSTNGEVAAAVDAAADWHAFVGPLALSDLSSSGKRKK